ncbi:uncharacterized protein CTRU02_205238 [Colletotrichum truncatum]|uniref:Uncharacterized protein n=1 Tax=Colletotrichum truncatum TaxID=5467 RepID=A0ACC3Z3F7_COLTU|nr:uncharacterized protein CTRU02_15761 [Colletotrichum truncatum]XP_036585433.1 uncharacterized protein CTRU02_04294 [Colletotrichum truncatum]KAF6780688.1 hypothetical protein CTRU02_15761 [Colletotrichum truncatum]KAF6795484.1 hypothetical protein CTRU02_04294 [Colletotrichum truncatum]
MRFSPLFYAALVAAAPATTSNAPEVEITNVSAKALVNNTLTFDFDVIDNANNQTTHCYGEWDDVNRATPAVPCTVPSYNATIYFPLGSNIESWIAFIGAEGRESLYLASVRTGTPNYVCGHSGSEGVLSLCFTLPGYKISTVAV